ncbi:MAG: hypothetical protein ACRC2K_02825 [Clostridium sp.]
MNKQDKVTASSKAKQMLIDGETYDSIMSATGLRLKDIKRIQKDEVSSHF